MQISESSRCAAKFPPIISRRHQLRVFEGGASIPQQAQNCAPRPTVLLSSQGFVALTSDSVRQIPRKFAAFRRPLQQDLVCPLVSFNLQRHELSAQFLQV